MIGTNNKLVEANNNSQIPLPCLNESTLITSLSVKPINKCGKICQVIKIRSKCGIKSTINILFI